MASVRTNSPAFVPFCAYLLWLFAPRFMVSPTTHRGPGLWDKVCSPKTQWWSLLALADLYVKNRPHKSRPSHLQESDTQFSGPASPGLPSPPSRPKSASPSSSRRTGPCSRPYAKRSQHTLRATASVSSQNHLPQKVKATDQDSVLRHGPGLCSPYWSLRGLSALVF